MPQMTLYSPENQLRTLHRHHRQDGRCGRGRAASSTVTPTRGGSPWSWDSGAVLDALAAALHEEGYPLGEASAAVGAAQPAAPAEWRPEYRVTRTDAGADVNYACPCSCEAGFAFDRSQSEQQPEGCCCGRQMLIGVDAEARLRSMLDATDAYPARPPGDSRCPGVSRCRRRWRLPRDGGEHGGG